MMYLPSIILHQKRVRYCDNKKLDNKQTNLPDWLANKVQQREQIVCKIMGDRGSEKCRELSD
jgi:hypothetical protein